MYLVSLTLQDTPSATEIFDTREQADAFVEKQTKEIIAKAKKEKGVDVEVEKSEREGVEEFTIQGLFTFYVMELSYREYTLINAVRGFVTNYGDTMSGMSAIVGKQMVSKVQKELTKMSDDIYKTLK